MPDRRDDEAVTLPEGVSFATIVYYWLRGAQAQGLLRPDGDWQRLIAIADSERHGKPTA